MKSDAPPADGASGPKVDESKVEQTADGASGPKVDVTNVAQEAGETSGASQADGTKEAQKAAVPEEEQKADVTSEAPPADGASGTKHLGLTVKEVEEKENRTAENGFENQWQPFDEVKNVVWIKQNTVYSVALEDWDQKVKLITERVDRMEKRSGDLKNEIYQLVGFFSVFQGVVLTAVTQMTQSPDKQAVCKKVWSPIILTGLAWVVTIMGVWQKLTGIHNIDQRCSDEDSSRRAFNASIILFSSSGSKVYPAEEVSGTQIRPSLSISNTMMLVELQEAVRWTRQLRIHGQNFKFSEGTRQSKRAPEPDPDCVTRWITRWFTGQVRYSDAFWTHRVLPIVAALSLFTGVFIASYFLIMCNRGLAPIHA